MKPNSLLPVISLILILAACDRADEPDQPPATVMVVEQSATTFESAVQATATTPPPAVLATRPPADAPTQAAASETNEQPEITAPPAAIPDVAPIEVTYFTPSQGEGPYYPLEKLDDRDNDLTEVEGAGGVPAGEVIEFTGKVHDATGRPVEGAVIEIWQTDANGVYLHPGDPGTGQRDRNFQFYGESVSEADGSYRFRTILPGHYEPRPRHIHVKVRLGDQELLTTQFYFEGDPELEDEAMFNQAGGDGLQLIISLTDGQDANGRPILIGVRDIILNIDLSG